jgi:hypothetical protein
MDLVDLVVGEVSGNMSLEPLNFSEPDEYFIGVLII